jgi:hypothetical protein
VEYSILDAGYFFVRECLVIFKVSHPIGPVGLDASSPCPWASGVKVGVPLQGPQSFKADFSDREIHKKDVYIPMMPVNYAVTSHN